jgi:hypothetical protein
MASFVACFTQQNTHEARCGTVWIYQTCREAAVEHKISINTHHHPRMWLGTAPPATERAWGPVAFGPRGCTPHSPRGHQRSAHRGGRAGEKTQGSKKHTQGKKPNWTITMKNCSSAFTRPLTTQAEWEQDCSTDQDHIEPRYEPVPLHQLRLDRLEPKTKNQTLGDIPPVRLGQNAGGIPPVQLGSRYHHEGEANDHPYIAGYRISPVRLGHALLGLHWTKITF